MASMKENAQCVLWHHETKSPVTVQRKFINEYGQPPPDVKRIKAWYWESVETGSVGDLNRSGRPSVSDEIVHVKRNWLSIRRSPCNKRSTCWSVLMCCKINFLSCINPLTPKDTYSGRDAPLTSKRCILCIYSTNTGIEYFKHGTYSPFFFSSKCSLFHNSNVFCSCNIHILYTGCTKI